MVKRSFTTTNYRRHYVNKHPQIPLNERAANTSLLSDLEARRIPHSQASGQLD
jgi:hypothetical protein